MATELARIAGTLARFFDPEGKTIVAVGAGGGRLVGWARGARRLIAVDRDEAALAELATRARAQGLEGVLELVHADFLDALPGGDALLLEFCLHELPDPAGALAHAAALAPDVIVADHAPGSRWMWCAAEEDGVERAWSAVARRGTRRRQDHEAVQRFADRAELEARLRHRGADSLARVATFPREGPLAIPMPYRLALL